MKDLAQALAKAQGEIKAALKDSKNPHFKSSYADLTSIWEACRGALTKNNLSVVQRTDFDAGEVWLETMLLHSSGDHITARYPLRPQQNTPQGFGSSLTYARRYCLAAMVGVVADEDDDGNAASAKPSNGHAVHDEPPRSTMQSRKTEAESIRNAREWVNLEALPAIDKIKTKAEYNAWNQANTKTLDRLKAILPDEHDAIEARLSKKLDQVEPLAAG